MRLFFQKFGLLGTVLLVAVLALTGCNRSNDKRIIILTNGDDPFFDAMRAGMNDAAAAIRQEQAALKDSAEKPDAYVVEMDKNNGTEEGQIAKLKQYLNTPNIVAVAVSVLNPKSVPLADAMRDLQNKGIKVITIDSDIDTNTASNARFGYIGTDNRVAGKELGKALAALRPEGGEFATFVGYETQDNAKKRIDGAIEGAGEKFKHQETFPDKMDLNIADKNVKDALQRYPDLKALVGIWAYNANAIAQNIGDRRKDTAVVVFDAAPKAITHMENGLIDALVVQNPYEMGALATKVLTALVNNDQEKIKEVFPAWDSEKKEFSSPDDAQHITGLKVVVPNDQSPIKAEIFAEGTEYLTLPQFKEWLAKNKLTGS